MAAQGLTPCSTFTKLLPSLNPASICQDSGSCFDFSNLYGGVRDCEIVQPVWFETTNCVGSSRSMPHLPACLLNLEGRCSSWHFLLLASTNPISHGYNSQPTRHLRRDHIHRCLLPRDHGSACLLPASWYSCCDYVYV